MKFESRIFWAIFLPFVLLTVMLAYYSYESVSSSFKDQFVDRYRALNSTMAMYLSETDRNVDAISANAVATLYQIDKLSGMPSENQLKTWLKS